MMDYGLPELNLKANLAGHNIQVPHQVLKRKGATAVSLMLRPRSDVPKT